jgi:heme/copper-type cytochrome/quinol oxidase subunit 2
MQTAAPETAAILLWTVLRGAALAVLATEAIFLAMRLRETQEKTPAQTAASRIFWALTPAVVLAGLAFWCAATLSASPPDPMQSIASLTPR